MSEPAWDDDDSTASYTSDEASQVLESERPEIEWPVPVEPEPSELEDALERADSLVSEIPDPLEEGHVPNGVIREAIAEDRTEAMAAREEAVDAAGPAQYHALRDARELHETARAAATAWLAIDADRDDLLRELRDERDAVQSVIDDHREALAYHGIDTDSGRLRAALYTYQRESDLERADRTVDRWSVHKSNDVLEIGESAGDLEFATTTTRIWEHFEDQYTREFGGDDSDDLEAVFERALERSSARAEEAAFPSQDGDSAEWYDAVGLEEFDHRPLEFVVSRAGSSVHRAHDRMDDALDTGSLGSGLHHALEFEQRLRGFERFRDWLAARDGAGPTDSDEIRAERDATLEAADAALELSQRMSLHSARIGWQKPCRNSPGPTTRLHATQIESPTITSGWTKSSANTPDCVPNSRRFPRPSTRFEIGCSSDRPPSVAASRNCSIQTALLPRVRTLA